MKQQKKFKMLDGTYAEALRSFITNPVLKTPASSTTQQEGNPGAVMEEIWKRAHAGSLGHQQQ